MSTVGRVIKCSAAVLWKDGDPLAIEEIEVDPPKGDEVRIKVVSTSVCHTDLLPINDKNKAYQYPLIPGHEGAGIIESVGENVTTFIPGDHVIPLYLPKCDKCNFCKNPRTNLCASPGMFKFWPSEPIYRCNGKPVHQFMGLSTFSEYILVKEFAVCKVPDSAPLDKMCLLGCGIPTGYGAALNIAQVTPGSTCVVFGLGGVGLAAVMGCKAAGAKRIVGVDINIGKFKTATYLGATDCINPKDHDKPIQIILRGIVGPEGADFTFECAGTVMTTEAAIDISHFGFGTCVLIGVTKEPVQVTTMHLLAGRSIKGGFFGGYNRETVTKVVDDYLNKKLMLDEFITHRVILKEINKALDYMREGKSIKTIISF